MSAIFQELDYRLTPIGPVSLRRRKLPGSDDDVFEIKLGDEFLMSSAFIASEVALTELGLARCAGDNLDVVVGGLGLGYTAKAALDDPRTGSLLVVEFLQPVIDWHEQGLIPLGAELCADARCRFALNDFFAAAVSQEGFDPAEPGRRHDAILVDIDHSPEFLLAPESAAFYRPDSLKRFARRLNPGGVFALWSNEKPDAGFVSVLESAFREVEAREVTFHNPLQDSDFTQTVYLATRADD
ncbi:spermidine synthase [Tepidamorphus sp. 3E244]|uniref:spermidine synthase n=1 Tax=Tepidamorphus sp. 3E244 TaxID=3385498 RepID=UPI0038FD3497